LALEHLSDEAASIVLAKHFGDMATAARELGVDRKDLQQLARHNPRILNAAHERMELFRIGVKSKIIEAVYSPSAKRRRWGYDALCDSYEFRDSLFAGAGLLAPAPCERSAPVAPVVDAQLVLEQEATAELKREAEADRQREFELEQAREAEVEASRRREPERTAALKPIPAGRPSALAVQSGSLWPANIRRPTRGRR
jgi:hypothetical protein